MPLGWDILGLQPAALRSGNYLPEICPDHIHFSLHHFGLKVQYIPAQRHRLGFSGAPSVRGALKGQYTADTYPGATLLTLFPFIINHQKLIR
jgi:hypothetical protein